jgi:2-keto-3-deoxy-L-fuconate dehydrogenase
LLSLIATPRQEILMRLQGKTALVTAAGQGIGHASALALAAEGAAVWATDVDAALLERFAGIPRIRTARLDVLDHAAITSLFASLPRLDVLFNCAGVVHHGSALDASDADLELAFALNVRSQLWAIQAALPRMLAHGSGSIVNVASIASSIKGLPNRCVYGLTKAAVIGLTKSVAADYVKQGIRCNALCPGTVDTPSLAGRIAAFADPVAARQAFIDRQPMGRLAQPEEIAPMVVYLASDESKFATGQAFCVDGGMTI